MKLRFLVLFFLPFLSHAQPFECDGSFFLSLSIGGPSIFYRVEVDPVSGAILFNQLPAANAGANINAIGYRITDNYIYGIEPNDHRLFQIDANGVATAVANLNLTNGNVYYAADVSPDGQFLTVLGAGGSPFITREFVKINLDDYSVNSTPIPNASSAGVFCSDIAFDPTDGTLYGFDLIANRLLTFNPDNGMINNTLYPVSNVCDAMGAIFFDAFGNIFGYGDQLNALVSDTFFKINKNTGSITIEAMGPPASGKDGCGCPYTVDLRKIVYPELAFPCTEVTYVFEIANASALPQTGIDFLDEMPAELTITEIIQNPYGGTVESGIGSNILSISDLIIPPGIDSLIIRVEIAQGAAGIYKNQAVLSNLPIGLGSETFSDDPRTLVVDDSTELEVVPLFVDLQNDTAGICTGDTLFLNAATYGVTYQWNDGSTDSLKVVTQEGLYAVLVSSGCETVSDSVYVFENTLEIDLGPDIEIILGDSVFLDPDVISYGNVSYQWDDPLGNSLNCLNCEATFARPFFDVEYTLSGIDEYGCTDADRLKITVDKSRNIYVPNVFSPNFDGTNDWFYIQGNGFANIRHFRIYNRWGALVFELKNGMLNEQTSGWDGTFKGKVSNPGVFVWYAEIEYLDGLLEVLSGDVTLLR